MNILGINYFFHDTSACVVVNGQLIVAIEEERLTRNKHTNSFPKKAIEKCLQVANLKTSDIDYIALSIQPEKNLKEKFVYGLKNIRRAKPFIKHELLGTYYKQKNFKSWFQSTWKDETKKPEVHFIPHHQAHAAGSFLVSPFESAAILSLDGSGEWSSSFLGKGIGNNVEQYNESFFPMSLGSFYEAVTEFCGFKPNYDEGKTMGLAPMGDSNVFYEKVSQIVSINDKGGIDIDLSYFEYQYWGYSRCSQKFYQIFGQPRRGNAEFEKHHLDLAAAFQRVLEDCALIMCDQLHQWSSEKNLILAGGVALNSVMNGRIVRESKFDDVYVMPAAGDNGTSIGAAYYVYNCILKQPRNFYHDNPYVGNEYSDEEIRQCLHDCKLKEEFHEDIEAVAAALLNDGEIIGWFQGKMEIGPRSLGNRSILANPVLPDMKDKINAEVKHREAYRPFAPSATIEAMPDYFENLGDNPFMLKVCDVLENAREKLPAITHVDGSARLQTVDKSINPRYHKLIEAFGELSGVPVLLNTSFNIMGEPMVESPIDAIRCFFSTGLDVLIIGNYVVRKV